MKHRQLWAPQEIALLVKHYGKEDVSITAKRFERTPNSVKLKASSLGLTAARGENCVAGSTIAYTSDFNSRERVLKGWEEEADRLAEETRQQEKRNAELAEVLARRRDAA